jgi:hypothetical protein
MNLDSREFECIVGVSSNDAASISVLERFRYSRPFMILDYGKDDVPMAAAYESLLSKAHGEWVSILGQDDGVLPWFFSELHPLLKKWPTVEAFAFRRAYFFWHGTESTYGARAVDLEGRRWSSRRNSVKVLKSCLLGLGDHYDLPQTYTNNLIRRSAVERMKSVSGGRLYWEPIPDVYSGVALAANMKEFVYSGLPLYWTGTSRGAAGYSGHECEATLDSTQSAQVVSGKSHSSRWKEAGYNFGSIVGEKLWLGSNSTPLYVLSALHALPSDAPLVHSRFWNQVAFSQGLAQILTATRSKGIRRTIELVKELQNRAKSAGFSLGSILLLIFWLFPSIQVLRFGTRVRRRLDVYMPQKIFGPNVSLRSDDKDFFARISVANHVVASQIHADHGWE